MANTTDFYSFPKRTVYENQSPQVSIPDNLIPSAYEDGVSTSNSIVIAWDKERPFTHFYFKGRDVTQISYNKDADLMGSGSIPPAQEFPISDNTGPFYALPSEIDARYIRFVFTPESGETPFIEALVPCELLLSFEDGAFNQIGYIPQFPTRGHHKMLIGGKKPFQGLGVKKRKMMFGAEQVPYAYIAREVSVPTEGYTQAGPNRYINPDGFSLMYRQADMTRLNRVFDDHLEFLFSDNIDTFPDRVLVSSFESNELEQSFTDGFKHLGYEVGFTVCEV